MHVYETISLSVAGLVVIHGFFHVCELIWCV